ncbi:hypothetical protein BDW74DRAFT_155260 [Aspergillus multicolor]|uniref:Zn(II)2Cys6 transcription factor n=1 Tax=Aspergillus multicolor TaxID=41759 RepID=UPI003CCE2517
MAAMEIEYSGAFTPADLAIEHSFLLPPWPLFDERQLTGTLSTLQSGFTPTSTPPRTRVKRPHTKSRRGCYNCKCRRVKCSEAKPACGNCLHKELNCVYPPPPGSDTRLQRYSSKSTSTSPNDERSLSPSLTITRVAATPFTGDDLRFWHHFLVDARPHLPFGDEATWLSTIPAFAHDCPSLLHALLSLGASHCALITLNTNTTARQRQQYHSLAISHRGKAISALNETFSKSNPTVLEMDGALATCYSLTFQAHHMADGAIDFAVMVRGCGLVTNWYFANEAKRESQIFNLKNAGEMEGMITSWLESDMRAVCDADTIRVCQKALDNLRDLLQTPAHVAFWAALSRCYEGMLLSHRHAFLALAGIYQAWQEMSNAEFMSFVAADDHISRVLFLHYITIDRFMRPVYMELARERSIPSGGGSFLSYRWVEDLYASLSSEMKGLVRDLVGCIALDLLPEVERHRRNYPEWNHELEGFIEWLRRWVSKEMLKLYNI